MALKDIFGRLLGKVRESVSEPSEFGEEEFDKDLVVGEEGEKDFLEETEPETAEKEEKIDKDFEEEFKEHETPSPTVSGDISSQFEIVKGKLDLIDAHIKSIESKEDTFRAESERLVQYFNFISEKIDHLERELAEVERLVKKRE